MRLRSILLAVGLLACASLSGCFLANEAAVGVKRVRPELVDEELNQNALEGKRPSASTLELLHTYGLREEYDDDPGQTLLDLHRALCVDPQRRGLHALAEIAFLEGKRLKSREHFLAAAVYAYLFLLGEQELAPASPYDRRFRWACDLYNRGLRAAFSSQEAGEFVVEGGKRSLPVGSLEIRLNPGTLPFDLAAAHFLAADDFLVWGLSLRQRDSGLGAPLIARMETGQLESTQPSSKRNQIQHFPTTAFLRVEGGLAGLKDGLQASLELHSGFDAASVTVGKQQVPLESDLSAALALALDTSRLWGFSSRGFFRGADTLKENRLLFARPYERGRVPVVFIHGTASNPGNWAEMFNLLQADPRLRERTQCWLFQYSTGNPILLSAAQLREQLKNAVAEFDPAGTDEALNNMVLVGHSQGGLLAHLMVVDGDLTWWDQIAKAPLESFNLPPTQQELVRKVLDFDPLPFVRRVVYMATPHRGSYQADRWFSRLLVRMIELPGDAAGLVTSLGKQEQRLPDELRGASFTSLDNMMSSRPFLPLLARQPLALNVKTHSIIPIGKADPAHPQKARDGVVAYSSAHIDGVESERLVPCGHSCQSNPLAIREVRRILAEHLAGLPTPARERY